MSPSKVPQYSNPLKMNLYVLLCLALSPFLLTSCSRTQQAVVEAPPAYQPSPSPELPDVPKLPAKTNEVEDAVKRVFKDVALIDTNRETSFVAGDFNGDNSQDIAVVIKPASGKLAEINDELPAWIIKDPFTPPFHAGRPRVEANDVLLAVIHGYGANDWRDPQATQTYLLKNAVGSQMEVHKKKDVLAGSEHKKIPRLQGDVIGETLRGASGYLYYTGPTYSWYDPKTFKGEPELRLVHPGVMPKSAK